MGKKATQFNKDEVLNDYKLANISRQCSVMGRKEVLTGQAKFGIFGDGKEVVQLAMAKSYKDGDWRSGYYRDQTLMMAIGEFDAEQFFAQLYGQPDVELNPGNAGRSFNNHFASRSLNPDGSWKELSKMKNSSSDISPTAGQMPRLVGLAWASKLFRQNEELHQFTNLSNKGNEVAFGTIGDASTSEGHFWESINAIGVLRAPMAMFVYDDGYGISVPQKYQTTKENISELLSGFAYDEKKDAGYRIYRVDGGNYAEMVEVFGKAVQEIRDTHIPGLFHVLNITQPLGHSTSGSHERYKSEERLQWEIDMDPITRMRTWILEANIATAEELDAVEAEAVEHTKAAKKKAKNDYYGPIKKERNELVKIIEGLKTCMCANDKIDKVTLVKNELKKIIQPIRKDNMSSVKKLMRHVCATCPNRAPLQDALGKWMTEQTEINRRRYNSHLHVEGDRSALKVKAVAPVFTENSPFVHGRQVLRENFDYIFTNDPRVVTFGEDAGRIGGVNQSLEGLQEKFGEIRITDTGIRETTIMGQGIGLALRGLRPITEIQYFDYLLYALQTMSDDLACTHYRTAGGQSVPIIVRTRGHRLEGIWHSGSPLSMVINSVRGVFVCVPRNMTQAAGFYNTLLQADDPALVIEPLNGYRVREQLPDNVGKYCVELGVPEILTEGTDITLVTYGSCVRIAQDAVAQLKDFNINVELIDVQTLLPFDKNKMILESIKKTNKILFFDEDVPGGATAYMMQKVLEDQKAFYYLDSEPRTLAAHEHRSAYATDGDYFSKPNAEDVFDTIYKIMHESDPVKYKKLF